MESVGMLDFYNVMGDKVYNNRHMFAGECNFLQTLHTPSLRVIFGQTP